VGVTDKSCTVGILRAAKIRTGCMRQNDTTLAVLFDSAAKADEQRRAQQDIFTRLGVHAGSAARREALPFHPQDITVGTENELAVSVVGTPHQVDLPQAIARLPFFAAGGRATVALEKWLTDNAGQCWEHSWLRVPHGALNAAARATLGSDLAGRPDRDDFHVNTDSVRVPASYVLKLALADVLGARALPGRALLAGQRALGCFLNDNTAPEIISTHIVSGKDGAAPGRAVARENAQRFLLTQLLTAYANEKFGLRASGQELSIYAAPNPPARLKALSRLLPADAYRELLMNPCLFGFRDGASKRTYMHVCHETLSHSRMHAGARLMEAGIMKPHVVERMVCDTSLLNNGTHVSLGSLRLGEYLRAQPEPTAMAEEKYLGDLATKIVEHFLPLFVGLYSAAPARLAPADLRPERALGFLPHELGSAHLRLTWQSWKRKAGLLTALKGDMVPDLRLLDYFAALPSSASAAAHDGQLGNAERLKAELEAKGLFSRNMTFYALYRLREFSKMGFTGFEGRHYSLFASLRDDLAPATDLQALITAYAYQCMARGELTHAHIPDDPDTESERRQMFFAAAIGLPVVYVRKTTKNLFLRRVLARTERTRPSKRHTDYFKVYLDDYRQALRRLLREDGALAETGAATLADLGARLAAPSERGVSGRLIHAILADLGVQNPMDVDAATFNRAAEQHYRGRLRQQYLEEGLDAAGRSFRQMDQQMRHDPALQRALAKLTGGRNAEDFLNAAAPAVRMGSALPDTLCRLIGLLLLNVEQEERHYAGIIY
jgi:hypothetical protein